MLLETQEVCKMKTSVVICILVVVFIHSVKAEPENTVEGLQNFLDVSVSRVFLLYLAVIHSIFACYYYTEVTKIIRNRHD